MWLTAIKKMVSGSPKLDFCNHLGQRDGKKSFSKLYYELCVKLNSLKPISDNSDFWPTTHYCDFLQFKDFFGIFNLRFGFPTEFTIV